MIASLLQDLRYGIRLLLKDPGFTFLVVLTLALGIGANTALFSVVKAVLFNSLPYRQSDRLVTLAESDQDTLNPVTLSYGAADDWNSRQHSFSSIAPYKGWSPTASGGDVPEILFGLRVTRNFFDTLGIAPALGRGFLPEEDRPNNWHVALLSYAYWMRRFGGNPSAVGKTLLFDGVPFQIVGVLPRDFQPLGFGSGGRPLEVWASLGYDLSLPFACRGCRHLHGIARLNDGVPLGKARAEMNSIAKELTREFPKDYAPDASVVVTPLLERWLGKVQSALWVLLGATALILLIACANVASLLLTRAAGRRREVALRAALGASPLRIARQLLTESTMYSLMGGAAGILLASWGTSLLVRWGPAGIPRLGEARLDGAVLLFTLLVSMATGILMGLIPALQAARVDQREALQETGRGMMGISRSRFRTLLVVAEVALAFVLAIGSGLLLRSFLCVMNVDPGFEPSNLYTVNFSLSGPHYPVFGPDKDKNAVQLEREALRRIEAMPGVEAAGIVSTLPVAGDFDRNALIRQDRQIPGNQLPSVDTYNVSPGYFRAMGIALKRGRLFTEADTAPTASPVAVISEAMASALWPGEDALGKHIQLNSRDEKSPWETVVGIVGDVHQYGLDSAATPKVYELYTLRTFSGPILVIRSSVNALALTGAVEQVLWSLDKSVPVYQPLPMAEILSDSVAQRRFTMGLLGGFGSLALLLAGIGTYGVMSYSVSQRTNEVGIRMALGALPRDVLRIVVGEGARLAAMGVAAGLIVSLAVTQLISGLLFDVKATDPLTFLGAAMLLSLVGLFASYVPARRASRLDPMSALRYE